MSLVVFARRWWPVLYGAATMAVLAYTSYVGSSVNEEMWAHLFRADSWRWQSPFPAMFAQALGITALMVLLTQLINRVDRKFDSRRLVRANVNFRPLYHRFWRWPFMVLFSGTCLSWQCWKSSSSGMEDSHFTVRS